MASVNVRLFHELRTAAGSGEITMTANTLGELLRTLADRYGKMESNVLFDETGRLREYVFVYINKVLQLSLIHISEPTRPY